MPSIDVKKHVREVYEQGFTYVPAFYSPAECAQMREIIDAYWRSKGSPALNLAEFGFTIHPLLAAVPNLIPFMDRPILRDLLGEVLMDEPRCAHLGSRMSDVQCVERLPWHHHYGWDNNGLLGRKRIERVLWSPYVDGSMDEVGPVVMYPRRVDDPIGDMRGPLQQAWPGEVALKMPPGSMTVFDTAVWHSAKRGTQPGRRRLWGAHFQGWNDPRNHPEDNAVDVPEANQFKKSPTLKSFISGK